MQVIGTAGHVDHGKSTLVKAITGIDPDRLKEEKKRALTIDLGFAWLTLPSGESVGVIDVPGHQDFIKNMLAGVGGIDAALLVIAADEGVMPQTREHLAILDLLEIPQGVIALTKIDMIDEDDWLELVEADIAETMADTVLAEAPIIRVSAMTGAGLDELRHTLDQLLANAPTRQNRGRARLPIDRVFSISGFGTVVTGTLLDGSLKVGEEIEILPEGLTSRIRGLQSHKKTVDVALPGSRTAVNLTGLNTSDLNRGSVLTTPGWLEPSQLVDVHLRLLPEAPAPLKHNQAVEVFSGTSEVMGYTRLLGTRQLNPGETGWVQLRLVRRIPIIKGDHFIIRQPSPSLTIGGGVVVDPLPRRRHRRFRPALIKRLETLLAGTPEELLLAELDRRGPLPVKTLVTEGGLPPEGAVEALLNLVNDKQAFALDNTDLTRLQNPAQSKILVASVGGWAAILGQIETILADFHVEFPLRVGMSRSELKSRLKLETRLFNQVISRGEQEESLTTGEGVVRLAKHRVQFSDQQQAAIDEIVRQFKQEPYNTPLPKEVSGKLGEELFLALLEQGILTRLSADVVILAETFQDFVTWLKNYLSKNDAVNVAGVRDIFKTSRKYALALLEYTDEQRITKRVGDQRVLR